MYLNAENQQRELVDKTIQNKHQVHKFPIAFMDNRIDIIHQKKLVDSITNVKLRNNHPRYFKTIQCQWDKEGVNTWLGRNDEGIKSIIDLNSQRYSVMKVANVNMKRTYSDDLCPHEEYLTLLGWHNRKNKIIAINNDHRDNKTAASTIVHEVAHANQHEKNEEAKASPSSSPTLPYPDMIAKEYDAHIKQEEFNLKIGIEPKHPSFRKDNGDINPDGIRAYLHEVYSGGGRPFKTEKTFTELETIRPWPFPIPLN